MEDAEKEMKERLKAVKDEPITPGYWVPSMVFEKTGESFNALVAVGAEQVVQMLLSKDKAVEATDPVVIARFTNPQDLQRVSLAIRCVHGIDDQTLAKLTMSETMRILGTLSRSIMEAAQSQESWYEYRKAVLHQIEQQKNAHKAAH